MAYDLSELKMNDIHAGSHATLTACASIIGLLSSPLFLFP